MADRSRESDHAGSASGHGADETETPIAGGVRSRIDAMRWPLRQPGLRRLVVAFLINELGDGIALIVLPLAVYAATESGILTGLSFAVVRGAALVGTPIGGLLADRSSRLRVLRVSFVIRALLLGVALLVDRQAITLLALLLVTVGGTIDNPAAEAAVRERAGDRLQSVATVRQASMSVSALVGPALGGILVSVLGVRAAITVDLATFVAGLALLRPGVASLSVPRGATSTADGRPVSSHAGSAGAGVAAAIRKVRDDATAGVRHLRSRQELRLIVFASIVNGALVAALLAAAVVYLGNLPGAPDGAYGFAVAAYSTGALVGLLVGGAIQWKADLHAILTRSLALFAVLCVAGVAVADWRMLSLAWIAWGVARGPERIVSDVILVEHTPDALLGRTYAGVRTTMAGGQVVGALMGGLLGDVVGPRSLMAGLSLAFLPASAWVFARYRTPER